MIGLKTKFKNIESASFNNYYIHSNLFKDTQLKKK